MLNHFGSFDEFNFIKVVLNPEMEIKKIYINFYTVTVVDFFHESKIEINRK